MHLFSAKDTEALIVSICFISPKSNCWTTNLTLSNSVKPPFKTLNSKSHNPITENWSALTRYEALREVWRHKDDLPFKDERIYSPPVVRTLSQHAYIGRLTKGCKKKASIFNRCNKRGDGGLFLSKRNKYDSLVNKDRKGSGQEIVNIPKSMPRG